MKDLRSKSKKHLNLLQKGIAVALSCGDFLFASGCKAEGSRAAWRQR
jgi:hypothetical protein